MAMPISQTQNVSLHDHLIILVILAFALALRVMVLGNLGETSSTVPVEKSIPMQVESAP